MLQRILFTLVHGVLPVVLGILLASLGVLFVYLAIHLGPSVPAGIGLGIMLAVLWQMGKREKEARGQGGEEARRGGEKEARGVFRKSYSPCRVAEGIGVSLS